MKQVLVKGGSVYVADVPAPVVSDRNILVQVSHTCISAGTEASSVRMSGLPLYKRALRQPENVRRVLQMVSEQGIGRTLDRVRGKLNAGSPTGYSAAGTVVDVGRYVDGFRVGDRVACAGAGYANHAEVVDVPVNLAVRIPDGVSFEHASTVTLGAIAMQGVRRVEPTLGENIVVVGLGLLGQLTVQLLKANGCIVIGVDPDASRRDLAIQVGAVASFDPTDGTHVDHIYRLTDGVGADAVIITAAAESSEIVSEAFHASRRKGRVVLVGDVGLSLRRSDFYSKEIDLRISASYGPGRYDPYYEEAGNDYPISYVRWTENRNMAAYLQMLAGGTVQLARLSPRVFSLDDAPTAFESISNVQDRALLSLLEYPGREAHIERTVHIGATCKAQAGKIRVAVIGAGGFAQGMHLPNLMRLRDRYEIRAIASRTGANAKAVAQQYQASYATTEIGQVLADDAVDLVVISTRHDLHATMALAALRAGKHVLLEKPLAIHEHELGDIEEYYRESSRNLPILMTGFNRRFSPATRAVCAALEHRTSPMIVNYRMNAGHIPQDHWVHGPEGGGRNVGEACHIYDLFSVLTSARPVSVNAEAIRPRGRYYRRDDNFVATVLYDDGSVCSLTYTALGDRSYPKERMEVFCDGKVIALDDYRAVSVVGGRGGNWASKSVEKGQYEELVCMADAIQSGTWPINLDEQISTTRLSFEIQRRLGQNLDSRGADFDGATK